MKFWNTASQNTMYTLDIWFIPCFYF